ncbi:hypothetical protein [Paenibacillus sp. MMS20-IR301]|uniref:hypothetical protein n=1 Tax=Paenibacillus sp. MMS20-IR301 TaxID=2895946 RepID=UPI0028EC82BF|nr:hypothetical protein [Paenibacillus sp. MMS20-IR301]WNS43867.1 hypothetical protein LOS79_00965 [Paenibacillus sp. MMS20-IR301]
MNNVTGLTMTGEDSFFITMLATWLSVRINTWGDKNYLQLLFVVFGILCYQFIIVHIRHIVFIHTNPVYVQKGTSNSRNSSLIFTIFVFVIISLYFSWKNTSYLKQTDIYIFVGVAVMWTAFPLTELISSYIKKQKSENSILQGEGAEHHV